MSELTRKKEFASLEGVSEDVRQRALAVLATGDVAHLSEVSWEEIAPLLEIFAKATGRNLNFSDGNEEDETLVVVEDAKTLNPTEVEQLFATLMFRFKRHMHLHQGIEWEQVEDVLTERPDLLWSLKQMEDTGGEPDVFMEDDDYFYFCDCSIEVPAERSHLVYDSKAEKELSRDLLARPTLTIGRDCRGNMMDLVDEWGVEMMGEEEYGILKGKLTKLDQKTNTFLKTPPEIREQDRVLLVSGRSSRVDRTWASNPNFFRNSGFRTVLKVPKSA